MSEKLREMLGTNLNVLMTMIALVTAGALLWTTYWNWDTFPTPEGMLITFVVVGLSSYIGCRSLWRAGK